MDTAKLLVSRYAKNRYHARKLGVPLVHTVGFVGIAYIVQTNILNVFENVADVIAMNHFVILVAGIFIFYQSFFLLPAILERTALVWTGIRNELVCDRCGKRFRLIYIRTVRTEIAPCTEAVDNHCPKCDSLIVSFRTSKKAE